MTVLLASFSVWSGMLLIGAFALAVLTVLPWVRTGSWVVRVCDFPRFQIAVVTVLLLCAALGTLLFAGRDWVGAGAAALLLVILLVQLLYIAPFLPLWPNAVAGSGAKSGLRVLVSNLDVDNDQKAAAIRAIEEIKPDLLVLIEVDERWANELKGLRERFAHRLEAVRPDGCGLVLWSIHELREGSVEFLVDDERPSLHSVVVMADGRNVCVSAVHPTPPGLEREGDTGRHDSRIRDAELVLLARKIAEKQDSLWLVLGDLNDSAWSRTTRLFLKISGMLDPRRGRGMFSTFPARKPLMRYPIDHVFVSQGFGVREMRCVAVPGSDHLAIFIDVSLEGPEGNEPEADGADHEEAAEIVEEGREDARK